MERSNVKIFITNLEFDIWPKLFGFPFTYHFIYVCYNEYDIYYVLYYVQNVYYETEHCIQKTVKCASARTVVKTGSDVSIFKPTLFLINLRMYDDPILSFMLVVTTPNG